MRMKTLTLALAATLLLPAAGTMVHAADAAPAPVGQVSSTGAYLGVMVAPVADGTRAQLGDTLPPGQGVLIGDVVADSPASAADLRPFDILLSYDDQKLYSPDQLSRLVKADSPNRPIQLTLVRGGKIENVTVTLSQLQDSDAAANADSGGHPNWMLMPRHDMSSAWPWPNDVSGQWDRFDSLSLEKLDDGSFQAQIKYLNADGKLVTKSYTGTRQAIQEQILKQDDMPSIEREQLINALTARDGDPFMFGPLFGHHMLGTPRFDWFPNF